ncbi:MAG TPA: Na/Pi symporter [Flavobacteriales bacterium]|nr:Na/Pi symporter [Flavobacteriales bacterium]
MGNFNLLNAVMLAGALGLLMYGMKLVSEGLQQVAGRRMRSALHALTADRLRGVLTGFATTLVMQYSSVVSVLVVSFANSGLLTLRKAIPVLIGANIGTTVKLLLFAAVGFSAINFNSVAGSMLAVALPLMVVGGQRARSASNLLVGSALLFLSFALIKDNLPSTGVEDLAFLQAAQGLGLLSHVAFVVIGAMLALLVQSSSLALVLTLALSQAGMLDYPTGASLVLGGNIGTTFIANIAALAGNAWGKRAARAHLLIKLIGVAWALLLFKPLLHGIAAITEQWDQGDPNTEPEALKWALAYLHVAFNLLNGLLVLQLIPWVEKTVSRMVPSTDGAGERHRLAYISDPLTAIPPALSLAEARREVARLGVIGRRMLGMVRELLTENDPQAQVELQQRIAKYEEITDRMEKEVDRFLSRTATEVRDKADSIRIQGMLAMTRELEQSGDVLLRMGGTLRRKAEDRLWFAPEERQELLGLFDQLELAFRLMLQNLDAEQGAPVLDEALRASQQAQGRGKQFLSDLAKAPVDGNRDPRAVPVLTELVNGCGHLGRHLDKVSMALADPS